MAVTYRPSQWRKSGLADAQPEPEHICRVDVGGDVELEEREARIVEGEVAGAAALGPESNWVDVLARGIGLWTRHSGGRCEDRGVARCFERHQRRLLVQFAGAVLFVKALLQKIVDVEAIEGYWCPGVWRKDGATLRGPPCMSKLRGRGINGDKNDDHTGPTPKSESTSLAGGGEWCDGTTVNSRVNGVHRGKGVGCTYGSHKTPSSCKKVTISVRSGST
ncbi:hypothetical protein K438DRAFT_1767898 [Mycena galopus ATCC 62051]|nr:hypothetical protein K438DRAFT_1767898 [Mycena galopus ATCC 62051]